MLSIIISTKDAANLVKIKKNIAETVGIEYEIIEIINNREFGLCTAYNKGAKKSSYSMLCFVHDDVLFHTEQWGKKVADHLQDEQTGLIGVAGGRYKSAFGLDWKDGKESFYRAIILDGILNSKFYFNPNNETKSRVICLDGLFLCCRKEVWKNNKFDEEIFKEFHFYDADWSMQIFQNLNNYVVYDIEIEHLSHGEINKSFLMNSFLFEKKWRYSLPVSLVKMDKHEMISIEGYALTRKVIAMRNLGFSFKERWLMLKKYFFQYKKYPLILRIFYYGFIKM